MAEAVGVRNQELLAEFAARLSRLNYARTTQKAYAQTARRFLAAHPFPLERVTPEHIERYLASLPISLSSYVVELERLRAFFKWAVIQRRLLKENPCRGVERPRVAYRQRPAPSEHDFAAIHCASRTLEECALVELFYFSGLRVAEARSLRVRNVDIAARRALVIGKGSIERQVIFPASTAQVLTRFVAGRSGDDWLFAGARGYARGEEWMEATCRRLGETARLPYPLTCHLLRHGFARLCKTRGLPVEVTARLMGHRDIATTVRIYGRLDADDLQAAYDRHISS